MSDRRTDKIFIYCDDPSHAPRRVAVTNFRRAPGVLGPAWSTMPASRADASPSDGITLVGDAVPAPGWANDPTISNADIRSRYRLECRKCRHSQPLVVRPETLHPALDALAAHGVSELPLAALAASLNGSYRLKGR
jgi:hypothetical protein